MKKILPLLTLLLVLTACATTTPADSDLSAPRAATVPPTTPTPTVDTVLFPNVGQQAYSDPDGRFTLVYPANWQTVPQPTGGVVFVDPTGRAAFGVQFTVSDTQLSTAALAAAAEEFVTANFGTSPGFSIVSRSAETVQFKTTDANLGPTINQITAGQKGKTIFFTQMTIVESLWAQTAPSLQAMLSTLNILQTEPAPTPTPPLAWNLYTSPPLQFAFLVPSNWDVVENGTQIRAEWPSSGMRFSVTFAPTQDLPQYLQTRLDAVTVISQTDIAPDTLGTLTGYKVDYLYSDDKNITMAASSFAGISNNNLYEITIAAPDIVFPTALDWFIPMLESVKFLSETDSQ